MECQALYKHKVPVEKTIHSYERFIILSFRSLLTFVPTWIKLKKACPLLLRFLYL